MIIWYSILFTVLAIGVFFLFIIFHKSFIQYSDGYRQGYFQVVEIKHSLESFMSGDGFSLWSWSKGSGMGSMFPNDPFTIFAALFPAGLIELGYTLAVVLKLYCSGLFFLIFGREVKLEAFPCVFGAICYAFSSWMIDVGLVQSPFLINPVVFPLVILGVERIYKGKSPLLFILMVAYYLIRSSYFAFMGAIGAFMYIVLRYFAFNDKFRIGQFAVRIGSFIIYGIIGGIISACVMLPAATKLSVASTDSASDTMDILFGSSYYEGFGLKLLSRGLTDDYLDIGIPILMLLLFPVAVRYINRKKTNVIMSILLLGMMMFPFFCSMFNGFGYCTLRWSFIFIFFAVWASAEMLDMKILSQKSNLLLMLAALAAITIWTAGFYVLGLIDLSHTAKGFIPGQIFMGFVMIAVIRFMGRKPERVESPKEWQRITIALLTGITLVLGWNWAFLNHTDDFLKVGEINSQLADSTQRVSTQINDDGFYRVDQVDGINLCHTMKYPANENLWWQSRNLYTYDSNLPWSQFEFNREMGNNYGYSKRVYILSNDNRMGLDFLFGVKYFLGNDSTHDRTGSDEYAGYGFAKSDTIDGVSIFRSKYDSGLGFAYDSFISEDEFLKLSRLEREQAILQAIVLPEEKTAEAGEFGLKEVKASQIDTDITNVPIDIRSQNGLDINGNEITVYEEDATFTFHVDGVSDSQMVVSFDNLIRGKGEGNEGSFTICCDNEKIHETAINEYSNQAISGIVDYDLNMGYYDSYSGDITVTLSEPGTYTFDRMYVSAMATSNFDRYAQEREAQKYDISSFSDTEVEGKVECDSNEMLFFSIPVYSNWDVYVDGERQDKITNANLAFMAVEVPEGSHDVVLKYHNKYLTKGIIITIVGLLLAALVQLVYIRRRNKGEQQ